MRYVDFAIGYDCNLKCRHCFATALQEHGRPSITPGEYSRIVRQAMKMGAVNFSFQGGEPLLYPELKDYIAAASPKANLISVSTNGTLITDSMLEKLKSWGVDILTVSLDSGIPAEHDEFRAGPGAFARVYQGVEKALKYGINVTLAAVVTSVSLRSEGINKLIKLSSELRVILMLILPVGLGRWKGAKDILLNKDDLAYLEALVLRHAYLRTDFYANYLHKGCGAVKEILYLNPYGDVFACPFIHKKLGNALKEPLKAIRGRALKDGIYKDYQNVCLAASGEVYNG